MKYIRGRRSLEVPSRELPWHAMPARPLAVEFRPTKTTSRTNVGVGRFWGRIREQLPTLQDLVRLCVFPQHSARTKQICSSTVLRRSGRTPECRRELQGWRNAWWAGAVGHCGGASPAEWQGNGMMAPVAKRFDNMASVRVELVGACHVPPNMGRRGSGRNAMWRRVLRASWHAWRG